MALTWNTQAIPWGRNAKTPQELETWIDENTSLFKYAYDKDETEYSGLSGEGSSLILWKHDGANWNEMRFYGGDHTGSSSSTVGVINDFANTQKAIGDTDWIYQRLDSTTLNLCISEAETSGHYFFEILREGTGDAYNDYHDFHVVSKNGTFHWLCGGDSKGSVSYGSGFLFPDGIYSDYKNKYKGNKQARSDASTNTNKRIMQKVYIRGNDYGIWSLDGGRLADNLAIRTEFKAGNKKFIQIGAGLALEI